MTKLNQRGSFNILILPLLLITLLFFGAAGFGYWAYGQYQDYKVNVAKKVAAGIDDAVKAEDAKKDAQFAEESKSPFKVYSGPEQFGAVQVTFPKTWSGYVDDSAQASGINGYFHPNVVPSLLGQNSLFALRVQVLAQSYSSVMQTFASYAQQGAGTIVPYSLPKVPSVVGVKLDGKVGGGGSIDKHGSMVVLPLRDKTLEIWTEAQQYVDDFNRNILPNLTFSP